MNNLVLPIFISLYRWNHTVWISLWFDSFTQNYFLRSIQLVWSWSLLLFRIWLNEDNIIYLSTLFCSIFGLFPVWGYYKQCCLYELIFLYTSSKHMCKSFTPRNVTGELYVGLCVFHFTMEYQTIFQSGQINLLSKHRCVRVPLFHILTNACETSFLIIPHSSEV